jgi:hypothetical protein
VTVALLVALFHAALASAVPIDTVLAQVDSRTISASDIALARALGVFGFSPSRSPIARADVDRYVDVLLILAESARIGVEATPAAVDAAWTAVGARSGGEAALTRWLEDQAITRALGPGQHDDDARERVRDRLIREQAVEDQAAWLVDARKRASIKILLPDSASVVPPFALP